MQKKIPYPKSGIVEVNGSRYIYGEGNRYDEKKKMRVDEYYFIKRYEKCSHDKCKMRSTFYGIETIGPRVYSIHKCIMGHKDLTRLVQNDGPELTEFLKKK